MKNIIGRNRTDTYAMLFFMGCLCDLVHGIIYVSLLKKAFYYDKLHEQFIELILPRGVIFNGIYGL